MTNVTAEKLKAPSKRWCPKVIELVPCIVTDREFEGRLAELGKLLYDGLCQRPKSLSHDLGMILEQRTTDE